MTTLLPIERCPAAGFAADDYVVFGGTFDPFHQGHTSVVRALRALFRRVLIAPAEANPWKADRPTALPLRREMIRLVLEAEGIAVSPLPVAELRVAELAGAELDGAGESRAGLVVITQSPYIYAEELVRELRRTLKGTLYWAVGEDSAPQVHLWRNWESLGVSSIVHPVIEQIHAADIRAGTKQLHPALRPFAEQHRLYR